MRSIKDIALGRQNFGFSGGSPAFERIFGICLAHLLVVVAIKSTQLKGEGHAK